MKPCPWIAAWMMSATIALGAQAPAAPPAAAAPTAAPAPATAAAILDAMSSQEKQMWERMQTLTPRVETYMQDLRSDPRLGATPTDDRYYLGALEFHGGFHLDPFLPNPETRWRRLLGPLDDKLTEPARLLLGLDLSPDNFVGMLFPDRDRFDRRHYRFDYVRQEFLGEVRCYVFDVAPLDAHAKGTFFGRIWIEDQDNVLVRFSGSFWQDRLAHPDFHFDSWRTNLRPAIWLPTYVYSEESDLNYGLVRHASFQAETRLWGYDLRYAGHQEELTTVRVEGADTVPANQAGPPGPVEAERLWERQAEDNILDRLEKAGLLAPPGPVEQVLQQVVNNLLISNQLSISPAVRCRVLVTTPIESATIGHTIVLSRGMIDSLPDEASLAAVLAHELAHIVLGQRLDTQYAFGDRMLFRDEDALQLLQLKRTPLEQAQADARAVELFRHSPYKDQVAQVGLYLRELKQRHDAEPHLFSSLLGNPWFDHEGVESLHALQAGTPPLQPANLQQIAALPLGGRLLMDAWNASLSLQTAPTVSLLSPREKMPLQITPEFPFLRRAVVTDAKSGAQ